MIRLIVTEQPEGESQGQFTVTSDQPMAVTVLARDGELHAFVYDHADLGEDSDPVGAYDSTIGDNSEWEHGTEGAS